MVLLFLIIVMMLGTLVPSAYGFQGVPHASFIATIRKLNSLKPGFEQRIEQVKERAEKQQDEESIQQLKTILDCLDALKQIDADLELFQDHLQGNDEKLKKTAQTFSTEFLVCKEEIEEQLNKILFE
jgi:molecular chaperone GrpE (heat shock protein)